MKHNLRSSPPKKIGLKSIKLNFSCIRKKRLEEERLEKMSIGELYSFVEDKRHERAMKTLCNEDPIAEARARYLEEAKALVADEYSAKAPATKGKTKARHKKMPVLFRHRNA